MCLSLICACVVTHDDVHLDGRIECRWPLDGPMEWGVCVYPRRSFSGCPSGWTYRVGSVCLSLICVCVVTHLMSSWMDLWSGECVFITYLCVRASHI